MYSQNVLLKVVESVIDTGDSNGSMLLLITALAILSVVGIVVACRMRFCAEGTGSASKGNRIAGIVAAVIIVFTMIFVMASQAFAAASILMDPTTVTLNKSTGTTKFEQVTFTSQTDGYLNVIDVMPESGVNAKWTCKYNGKTIYYGSGEQTVVGAVEVKEGESIKLDWSVKFDNYKDVLSFDKKQIATFEYEVGAEHIHELYDIQSDGEWDCQDCGAMLDKTDKAYITVLDEDGQPTTIIPLTDEDVASTQVGNGTIVKTGNDITYANSGDAQTVVIRTTSSSTNLIVNAPNDTVKHYDTAGLVSIPSVAPSSFHEFGDSEMVKVAQGRVVLEKGADVEQIHIVAASKNVFNNIVVAMDPSVEQPTFSRDAASAVEKGSDILVVELQYDTNNTEETDTSYIWLTNNGIYEQTKASDTKSGTKEYVYGSDRSDDVKKASKELSNNYCGARTSDGKIADVVTGSGDSQITVKFDYDKREFTAETGTAVTPEQKQAAIDAVTSNASMPEVRISKTGEDDQLMSLAMFRDNVNAGTSYAGYTVTLLKNIDLSSVSNWTPIGTSDKPFSGVFDGDSYTVYGLTITSTAMNQGLFGFVKGEDNSDFNVDSIWDNTKHELNTNCIAESKYTAVIKNLNIENAEVTVTFSGVDNDSEATGGLVGKAKNAYISNIQMVSGTVKGYKQVGGVAGYLDTSVICECSNTKDFNVTLNDICKYTVAGIVGTTRTKNCAIINCTNNANISGKGSTCMAGVVGQMTSSDSLIYGCINKGNVTGLCDSTTASESNCICGIAGQSGGAKYIVNCSNTGTISNTAGTYGQISGISGYRSGVFYNCSNTGTITGKALYVAGISGGHSGNTNVTTVEKCTNTGVLSNSYDANRIASYIGTSATVILKDMTIQTPDDLNTVIYSLTGADMLELDNVHFSSGSTWNYSVVNSLNVKINDNCDKPEIVIGNVNNKVGIEGNNLSITIPETTTLTQLTIKGNNTSLSNNGTVSAGLVFGEDSQNETITNLGSIDVVTIKGSSNTFNNGDAQHTSSSVSKYIGCNCQNTTINNYGKIGEGANTPGYNVMNFDSASGSVVNNYGIIYGRGNNANYAIGMEESGTVTFNLYSGSKLIKRDGGWIIRSGDTNMTLNLNWATGTIFTSESEPALEEEAVNSISSVSEAGATCTLTINRTKTS